MSKKKLNGINYIKNKASILGGKISDNGIIISTDDGLIIFNDKMLDMIKSHEEMDVVPRDNDMYLGGYFFWPKWAFEG